MDLSVLESKQHVQKGREAIRRSPEQAHKDVRNELKKLNTEQWYATPEGRVLTDRFERIHQRTKFFEYEARSIAYGQQVIENAAHHPELGIEFSQNDKSVFEMGTLLSDIGKSGPRDATPEQQNLILEMFSVLGVNASLSVEDFLRKEFAVDADQKIALFTAMQIGDPHTLTMEQFWDKHNQWTHDIIKDAPIPPETFPAAVLHHKLKETQLRSAGVFPESVVNEHDEYTQEFGSRKRFGVPEKLVILMDMYEALKHRSNGNHESTIQYLSTQILQPHPQYGNDPEFLNLLQLIDITLKDHND